MEKILHIEIHALRKAVFFFFHLIINKFILIYIISSLWEQVFN